jgi:lysophospholipase L1-like esterase
MQKSLGRRRSASEARSLAIEGKKNLVANSLLVLFAVLAVSVVFEIALRWLEPVSDVQVLNEARTAHGAYLTLRPGAQGLMLGRPVTVNKDGYRGALRPQQKPPGVTRLLFFGDSHTFSMGADDEHTYPAVVEQKLNAGTACCEVLNFGVPGQDLRQILTLLHERGLAYQPDVVVITFHSGDILESPDDDVPGGQPAVHGEGEWLYQLKVAALRHSYLARLVIPYSAAFLRGALNWTAGVTFAEQREIESDGPTWRTLSAEVLRLKAELDRRGSMLAFVLFPSMLPFEGHPARGEFADLAAWLESHGIPTIDLLPSYKGRRASSLTASLLDKHPNEAGYAIAGEAVAEFLGPRIKRWRAESRVAVGARDASDRRPEPAAHAGAAGAAQ